MNSKFGNRVRREIITVACLCKKDRTVIPKRALQLEFEDRDLMDSLEQDSFKQVLEDVKKREVSRQEIEGEGLWTQGQNSRLFIYGPI